MRSLGRCRSLIVKSGPSGFSNEHDLGKHGSAHRRRAPISSAYRKPHTCRQHRAAFNGGVTYTDRARTALRRIRTRKTRTVGLLGDVAAITALSVEWRASSSARESSSSTAIPPIHVLRGERPGRLSETGGAASTGRLGLGEADGLRATPRSRRSRLPCHVRRPYARSQDAALISPLAAGADVPAITTHRSGTCTES